MGEAKRRKSVLKDQYGQESRIVPWLPVTKSQSEQFMKWTTRGSWIGIGSLIVLWMVIRFLGPTLGWWNVK